MEQHITYIGLDVHKDTIAVAVAVADKREEVREYGKIANTSDALKTLTAKLSRAATELRFCYEAGPCGYGIQRQLTAAGHGCVGVAPSLIPRKPGDRIKTDGRDAVNLARLHRAGELTQVWVPDQTHEAIRDLVRARLAAVRTLRQARQQLSGFLLRHGHHYHRPTGTLLQRRWLAGLKFEQPVHHIVLEDCIAAVEAATARRDRTPSTEARWVDTVRPGAHRPACGLPMEVPGHRGREQAGQTVGSQPEPTARERTGKWREQLQTARPSTVISRRESIVSR